MTDKSILKHFEFTERKIKALPIPTDKAYYVHDTLIPGFKCRITPATDRFPEGTRTFYFVRRPRGSSTPVRYKICRLGEMPIESYSDRETVRSVAWETFGLLRKGKNPIEVDRERQAEEKALQIWDEISGFTFGDAFELYY